jgi:hypothetical protein
MVDKCAAEVSGGVIICVVVIVTIYCTIINKHLNAQNFIVIS